MRPSPLCAGRSDGAAMAMNANVLGSSMIAGIPHVTCELRLSNSTDCRQSVDKSNG